MTTPHKTSVRVFGNLEDLSRSAAEYFFELYSDAPKDRPFTLALSGGSTPKRLYEILSSEIYRPRIDWNRIEFFFGDERSVPRNDRHSNFAMAERALFSNIKGPSRNIHSVAGRQGETEEIAKAYQHQLARVFGTSPNENAPPFDLILLGLGNDAHIASLFPGSKALDETSRWVVPSTAATEPRQRITFTLPLINAAKNILFLVVGEDKANAVSKVFKGPQDVTRFPAQGVRPVKGRTTWFLDQQAATLLPKEYLDE